MPSLPDIPGKSLVTGSGRRAGKAAVGAGLAVIAIGGYLARRLVRRRGEEEGTTTPDPIAETPTAPPATEERPPAEAKPEPAPPAEPPSTTGTDAPPKPDAEPGDISMHKDPHHALNNP